MDDPDLDGDGFADYRLPAIWEYLTPGGYRSASELTGDLGKVARYVALDLLFTASPIYPPSLTGNRMPDKINLDLNTYEGIPGVDASKTFQNNKLLVQELGELLLPESRLAGVAVAGRLIARRNQEHAAVRKSRTTQLPSVGAG